VPKQFRPYSLDQEWLLPPSMRDWLPQNHLARFIAEVTQEMNVSSLFVRYRQSGGQGMAAYNPLMLLRLLLYGYCVGRRSSRGIEKATYDEVAFRYLSGEQHPDHDTIATFRKEHLEQISQLFSEVLQLCQKAGLVKLGRVAIDGTKMRANADRNQTKRYGQMEEQERGLQAKVQEMLAEAARADAEEDARYGQGQKEKDLPAELDTVEKRLEKIRAAKRKLEQEAAERRQQAEEGRAEKGGKHENNAAKKRYQRDTQAVEKANPQHNFTDEDSKLMKNPAGGYMQGYNAQAAAGEGQVIVAAEVTNEAADQGQLVGMVKAVTEEVGSQVGVYLADAGYFSVSGLENEALVGKQILVSPESRLSAQQGKVRIKHELAQKMRERLANGEGREAYRQRAGIIEPVFAYIKHMRGIRGFLLRGLAAVKAEWRLICLTHNLLKLWSSRKAQASAMAV
jgi:transposase